MHRKFKLPSPPPLPDPILPFRSLRKVIKEAKKGIREGVKEIHELGEELGGKKDTS